MDGENNYKTKNIQARYTYKPFHWFLLINFNPYYVLSVLYFYDCS